MLIELINTHGIDLNDQYIDASIQNLLCAHREGKHLIIADVSFLKAITEFNSFGNRERNTAQSILQNIKETTSLKNNLTYYCKVDMSSKTDSVIKSDPEDNFFIVGHRFFFDSSKTQRTKLLCEDINDFKIYKLIAEYFRNTNRMSGVNISLEVCNGGGANTKKNFEQINNDKYLCFCLLDSDKKHPNSKIGSTAANFNNHSDSAWCKHHIIESHEVESLIPMDVIEQAILQKHMDNSYINSFSQLNAIVSYKPQLKIYFDHKMGLKVNEVRELEQKYGDDFWSEALLNAPNFRRKKCINKMECQCKKPCFAIEGFSANLLDAGAKTITSMSHVKLDEVIPSNLKLEWKSIGKHLFSWGCASRQRVRTS